MIVGDWVGHLPASDTTAARTHRLHQGVWRSEVARWPAGPPQKDSRVRDRYPTLPNWLAEKHAGLRATEAGINVMSPEARQYARQRLTLLSRIDGKAEADRLWRNLLSSQPLAFSIAGHLRAHPSAAVTLLGSLTGLPVGELDTLNSSSDNLADYALEGIEAEWFPPRADHTGDMSGFDIATCLRLEDGRRALVSIEVKYTDSFSAKPVEWARYGPHLTALGLDQRSTAALVRSGCSQVLRQVMITDSIHRHGLTTTPDTRSRIDTTMAVVLAREDDPKAADVVTHLNEAIGARVPVAFWSHRDLIHAAAGIDDLRDWANGMAIRYLLPEAQRGAF